MKRPWKMSLRCLAFFALAAWVSFGLCEEVVYYHTDAQGSVVAVTDANGNVVERTRYAPYGETVNRPLHDGPGYAGHETDAATGLTYMQQRYYDPTLGRFLGADPVAANAAQGNFNRYWYANNNPYRYIDPDGRESGAGYATGEYQLPTTFTTEQANAMVGVLPIVGNLQSTVEAISNPTPGNIAIAVVSLVPEAGAAVADVAKVARVAEAAKVSGAAQVTRAAGKETMHAATSARIAGEQAARADAKSVHLNQTISTATGKEVNSSLRPDVQTVRTDGKVDVHEVLSPGQDAAASVAKYNNALGDKAGTIKCVPQDKC